MIRLRIDGQECDLYEDFTLPEKVVQLDVERLGELNAIRQGHSIEVEIPSTIKNDELMGYPTDTKSAEHFNESYHEAEIEVDGSILLRGVAHLIKSSAGRAGALAYRLRVHQGGVNWVESMARKSLSEADLEYNETFNGELIQRSWSEDVAVRFLPLHYDSYTPEQEVATLNTMLRITTLDDYHPFISVSKLTKAIFAQAGYEVESDFMQSKEFQRLLISGKYASRNSFSESRLASFTGFEAGRDTEVSTTASDRGVAWLSQAVLTNSTGNFVNTTQGEGLYNSNGVFSISEERGLWYHPKSTQMVGFEYELRYKTGYKVSSPTRLTGFDSIYLGENADFQFELPNPFKDCRESLRGQGRYVCRIFGETYGRSMRLVATLGSTQRLLADIYEHKSFFTVPEDMAGCSCELQIYETTDTYVPYQGEWAIYESYVEEEGEVEVAIRLRTPAEEITPTRGKAFNGIYLYGAQPEQKLTLLAGCRLRAVFSPVPAMGTALSWSDLAPKDVTQLEFIESLGQMFNLRFITSESERKVRIEPLSSLRHDEVVDWRERVILSEEISFSEAAEGVARERTLGYRTEVDGAVERFNAEQTSRLGEWKYVMKNYLSTPSHKQILNPLFSPTLTAQTKSDTPSAQIMQVGNRDAESQSVTTRVVSYRGMKPLPTTQRWGYPSFGQEYPYATFLDSEEGISLCFEDRDGVVGLHRYYDQEWQEQDHSHEITISIKLLPHELEELCDAESAKTTLGSQYLLNISGEETLYRLQVIESYDKERAVARCRFRRALND